MGKYLIGVDIGGTKCAVTLARVEGEEALFMEKRSLPTASGRDAGGTIGMLFELTESILKAHSLAKDRPEGEPEAIGISCGGPLDAAAGVIMSPPNLPGWDEIPIVRLFQERFGIPAALQNDADAGALAEWRFGAARGCSNVIFLTFGTGMGAGLILNGRLYNGTSGMAGEIGHVRMENSGPTGYGKSGSFEGFCSGGGIAQIARSKVLERLKRGEKPVLCPHASCLPSLTAGYVAEAAFRGDRLAQEIYETSGYYLGRGLSVLIDVLNPEMIVIGSIFARSGELMWKYANRVIEQEALPVSRSVCRILPAALGDRLGDYAAISAAGNEVLLRR